MRKHHFLGTRKFSAILFQPPKSVRFYPNTVKYEKSGTMCIIRNASSRIYRSIFQRYCRSVEVDPSLTDGFTMVESG